MLYILFVEDSHVEYLICSVSSCSETRMPVCCMDIRKSISGISPLELKEEGSILQFTKVIIQCSNNLCTLFIIDEVYNFNVIIGAV